MPPRRPSGREAALARPGKCPGHRSACEAETLLRRLYEAHKAPLADRDQPLRRTCGICRVRAPAGSRVPCKAECPIPDVAAYLNGVSR